VNAQQVKPELNGSQVAIQLVLLASLDKPSKTASAHAHQDFSRPPPVLDAKLSSQDACLPNTQIHSLADVLAQQDRLLLNMELDASQL